MERIGKYDIVSILGQGAVSVVYKAFDPIIERYVAIKTVRKDPLSPELEELRQRFVREAKAAGRFHHPNIVSVFECGEDAGQSYIVMEFVNGNPLSTYLWKQHQFSIEEIRNIIVKVLEALDYAHSMDVVHRDIKPSNVILSENGEVKITDFGIARLDSSTLTRVGMVIGTPSYMSPEQLLGKRVDHRTDLYAAGLLLYELLTHKRAFEGSNPNALMYQVVNGDPIPPRSICSEIPEGFDSVIEKALAKQPGKRFQTGKEFIEAIDQLLPVRSECEVVPKSVVYLPQGSGCERPCVEPEIHPTTLGEPGTETAVLVRTRDGKKLHTDGQKRLVAGLTLAVMAVAITIWIVAPHPRLTALFDDQGNLPGLADEVSDRAKSPEVIAKHQPDGTRIRENGAVDPARQGKVVKDCPSCPERLVVPPDESIQGLPHSEAKSQINKGPQDPVEAESGVESFYASKTAQSRTKRDRFGTTKSQAWERLKQHSKNLETNRSHQFDNKTSPILAGSTAKIGKGGAKKGGIESSSLKSSQKIAEGSLTPPSLAEGRQASKRCYKLGPFSAKEAVERLTVDLGVKASWSQIVSDPPGVQTGFWVLHPPGDNFQASRAIYESIKARGIEEIWLFSSGELRGFISLGLFKFEANAAKELARITAMGINGAEMRPWIEKEPKYWLLFLTSEMQAMVTKEVRKSTASAGRISVMLSRQCPGE